MRRPPRAGPGGARQPQRGQGAPGTGSPVPGGLNSAQALALVRAMGPLNLAGAGVGEAWPPFDHGEITALAAAQVAAGLLCVLRKQKLARQAL